MSPGVHSFFASITSHLSTGISSSIQLFSAGFLSSFLTSSDSDSSQISSSMDFFESFFSLNTALFMGLGFLIQFSFLGALRCLQYIYGATSSCSCLTSDSHSCRVLVNSLEGILTAPSSRGFRAEPHFSLETTFFLIQLKTMARVDDRNWLSSAMELRCPAFSICSGQLCRGLDSRLERVVNLSVMGVDNTRSYGVSNSSSTSVFCGLMKRRGRTICVFCALLRNYRANSCGFFPEKKSKLKYSADTMYQKQVGVSRLQGFILLCRLASSHSIFFRQSMILMKPSKLLSFSYLTNKLLSFPFGRSASKSSSFSFSPSLFLDPTLGRFLIRSGGRPGLRGPLSSAPCRDCSEPYELLRFSCSPGWFISLSMMDSSHDPGSISSQIKLLWQILTKGLYTHLPPSSPLPPMNHSTLFLTGIPIILSLSLCCTLDSFPMPSLFLAVAKPCALASEPLAKINHRAGLIGHIFVIYCCLLASLAALVSFLFAIMAVVPLLFLQSRPRLSRSWGLQQKNYAKLQFSSSTFFIPHFYGRGSPHQPKHSFNLVPFPVKPIHGSLMMARNRFPIWGCRSNRGKETCLEDSGWDLGK